jgi:hypothetical protein
VLHANVTSLYQEYVLYWSQSLIGQLLLLLLKAIPDVLLAAGD